MASGLSSPNEVRRRVSPERSVLKVSSLSAATVRQQPLTAMLLETPRNGAIPAARTVRRPPSAPHSSDFTKPRCSMIPVNIGQVSLDCEVRAEAVNGNIFQSPKREAICKRKRHVRASSDFCRIKKEELVHHAGGQGGAVQSAPRFENYTEDIAFSQLTKDRFQIRPPASAVGLKDFDAGLFQGARSRILRRLRGHHQHVFIRRFHELRFQRKAEARIENHAKQFSAAGEAAAIGEERVVGEDSADAGQECVRSVAHAMDFGAGLLGSDPRCALTLAGLRQRELAIEGQRGLEHEEWALLRDPERETLVQSASLSFANTGFNGKTCAAELREGPPGDGRVWVGHRGHDAVNFGAEDCIGARPRAPRSAAWLKGDIERGALRVSARRFQSDDFGVVAPVVLMKSFANHLPVFHEDRADRWIRAREADAFARQFQRAIHVGDVVRFHVLQGRQSKRELTKVCGSKGTRSPICSPVPTKRIGRPSSRAMAMTMPPLAVPSSLVKMIPVTPTELVNSRACDRPFCPVVASITSKTSWGAPGTTFAAVRFIFSSSAIRLDLVCRRPAVSTMTASAERARPAATASKTTAAGSAPGRCLMTSTPLRLAQTSSCSTAAARKVSAAQRITLRPSWRRRPASLPMLVVLPVPLTPTTKMTRGAAPFSATSSPRTGGVAGAAPPEAERILTSCALISCLRWAASERT